jgi:hypothetical protein
MTMRRLWPALPGAAITLAASLSGLYLARSLWEGAQQRACQPCAAPPAPPAAAPATAPPPDEREAWIGVAAAAGDAEAVVWSKSAIWSVAQRRFLLEGASDVAGVAVMDDGTVFAIRGDGSLGIAKGPRADEWQRTPLAGVTLGRQDGWIEDGAMLSHLVGLEADGPWMAWFVRSKGDEKPRLALTRDRGRSWTVQLLPEDDGLELEAATIHLRAGGRIDLLAAYYVQVECGAREAARFEGRLGSNEWTNKRVAGGEQRPGTFLDYAETDLGFGHDGRIHPLATVHGTIRTYAVRAITGDDGLPMRGELVRILGRRQIALADAPLDLVLMTVDQSSHPAGLAQGRVEWWSEELGWQSLELPAPPLRSPP